MKNTSKIKSAKPSRKRRAPKKVTEVFEDCTIAIQGDLIWMSGPLADEIAKAAKNSGMTFQEMFNDCLRISLPKLIAEHKPALPEIVAAPPKPAKSAWKPIPETLTDGWLFGSYTRYAEPKGCRDGDGFVISPDGQRAELDWYVGTDKLKRITRSSNRIWGLFEVGFPRPVTGKADLVENFRAVLPQIKAAFARHQKRRQGKS